MSARHRGAPKGRLFCDECADLPRPGHQRPARHGAIAPRVTGVLRTWRPEMVATANDNNGLLSNWGPVQVLGGGRLEPLLGPPGPLVVCGPAVRARGPCPTVPGPRLAERIRNWRAAWHPGGARHGTRRRPGGLRRGRGIRPVSPGRPGPRRAPGGHQGRWPWPRPAAANASVQSILKSLIR